LRVEKESKHSPFFNRKETDHIIPDIQGTQGSLFSTNYNKIESCFLYSSSKGRFGDEIFQAFCPIDEWCGESIVDIMVLVEKGMKYWLSELEENLAIFYV
jgi:hypothetical protein